LNRILLGKSVHFVKTQEIKREERRERGTWRRNRKRTPRNSEFPAAEKRGRGEAVRNNGENKGGEKRGEESVHNVVLHGVAGSW